MDGEERETSVEEVSVRDEREIANMDEFDFLNLLMESRIIQ